MKIGKKDRVEKLVIFSIAAIMCLSMFMFLPTTNAATINVPGDYPTIQAAVNAANPGDIILVAAGTYNEMVSINKPLTLRGANWGIHPTVGVHPTETVGVRGPETILSHNGLYAINPSADYITIDGFKFTGTGGRIIDTYANANYFSLLNCIFNNPGDHSATGNIQFGGGSHTDLLFGYNIFIDGGWHTFYAGGGPFDRMHIIGNKFNGYGEAIFWAASPLVDAIVEYNEFDGVYSGVPGDGGAYMNIGQGGNIIIKDNWFHDLFYTGSQVGIIDGEVTGNTFENIYPYTGYWGTCFELWGGQYGTAISNNVLIEENDFYYNDISGAAEPTHGIRLRAPETGSGIDGSAIHVHYNNFYDAEERIDAYAVWHQASGTVDAECNWWSDVTGPYDPTLNPGGLGSDLSGNVDFICWLDDIYPNGDCIGGCCTTPICRNVEDNLEYCTIQAAIDASTTANGETIEVYAGTHIEQVDVYKSLTIYGQGIGNTIIQSPDTLTKYFTSSNNNYPIVYIHDIDGVVIHDLTVDGAGKGNANYRFVGIGIYKAGATVEDVELKNIRDTPFSGAQHGVAIYGFSDQTGTPHNIILDSCNIHDYQKNAVALIGSDLTVDVSGCTVTGVGPTTVTAQNGIQVSSGATGSITDNTVTGCSYTGPNWAASGILPQFSGGVLYINGNILSENQVNVYLCACSANVYNNTISASAAGTGQTYFYGIIGDPGDPPVIPDASPVDQGTPPSQRITYVMNCMGNILNGDGSSGGVGIGVYAGMYGTYDIDFTATYNNVLNWGVGFELYEYAPNNLISAEIHYNNIVGNDYGVYNWLTTTYNANCNWWGDISGPSGNGPGTGDYVSTYITYCPWLDDAFPNGNCLGGTVCWNTRTGIYYCCIQCAIDDPLTINGDTIEVFDGVHYEHVVVHKSLTLTLDPVRAPTVIDGGGSGVGFLIKAPNVVIDGFEIRNCQIGIRSFGAPANYQDLTIMNCEIHSNTQNGILLVFDTFDDVDIHDCYIHDNGQNGIGMGNGVTITNLWVYDTTISGSGQHNMYFSNVNIGGIALAEVNLLNAVQWTGMCFNTQASTIGNLYIEGGVIANNNEVGLCINQAPSQFGQIWLYDVDITNNGGSGVLLGGGTTAQNLKVEYCTFAGNGWEDFDLSGGWFGAFNCPSVIFEHNDFYGSAWCGIYIGSAGNLPNILLFENNFYNPSLYGVYNLNPTMVQATCNYWGHITGPRHSSMPYCTQGRIVYGNAIVKPYLHAPYPGGICINPVIADPDGPYYGNVGENIYFTGSATGGVPPYTWYWTLGDGTTSTLQNPTHNYWTEGYYPVTLTITDSLGITSCVYSTSATIVPVGTDCEPEVWVDDDYTLSTPGWQVTHFALLQYALDAVCPGGIVHVYPGNYGEGIPYYNAWRDGITIIGEDYTLSFNVNTGNSAIITLPLHITGDYITVNHLVFNPSTTGAVVVSGDNAEIQYNKFLRGCLSNPIGIINLGQTTVDARFNWWGRPDGPSGSALDANTGRIADGLGVKIVDSGPVLFDPWAGIDAVASASKTTVETGESILFNSADSFAMHFDGTTNSFSVFWDFGDGMVSMENQIAHVFDTPGTYQVSMRIMSQDPQLWGEFMFDWDYLTITVTIPGAPLSVNADGSDLGGYETVAGEKIQLFGIASGGTAPYSFSWDFGDGKTSDLQNPTHIYSNAGTYTATLTVVDDVGEFATDSTVVTVHEVGELVVSIIVDKDTITNLETLFTASINGGVQPYSFSWDFGDGTISTDENPTHEYENIGTYIVTLTVTDSDNNMVSDTATIVVKEGNSDIKTAEIRQVSGGFRITAIIAAGSMDCSWNIKVQANFLFIGGENSGIIKADTQETVKLPLTLAFGKATITVTADDVQRQYTGFALGPLFLNLQEA